MRSLLFILMFVPFITFAQDDNDAMTKKSDGKLTLVSAAKTKKQAAVRKDDDKKKLKEDIVYFGGVKFTVGGNEITCDSAISYENEGTMAAFKVKIMHPQSFTVTGDVLNYVKDDAKATLTSNITITALNGTLVGTSNSFDFDFGYERYRINNGIITPPKEK